MPFHLPPIHSRRDWLKRTAAATGASLFSHDLLAAPSAESSETWVLFSDTHISEDPALVTRGACMAENLKRCVAQVLKSKEKPFGLMVNGDLAHNEGKPGDYDAFVGLMQPLREAGLAVHLTLGNHDNRETFAAACTGLDLTLLEEKKPVEKKHVSSVSSARMHWVLLDSLDQVNVTPGLLGPAQLGWLDRTLRNLSDKPTLVMMHHNPSGPINVDGKEIPHLGLQDTDALYNLLANHKKVKGIVYGHTHNWSVKKNEKTGLHEINLPPVAYVFGATRPNGWVKASVTDDGIELELRCLNVAHDDHGKKIALAW
jgi:Icc protein